MSTACRLRPAQHCDFGRCTNDICISMDITAADGNQIPRVFYCFTHATLVVRQFTQSKAKAVVITHLHN